MRRGILSTGTLVLLAGLAHGAPVCVPAHPRPLSELAPDVVPEEQMSLDELEKLAAQNNPTAMSVLGVRYGTGEGAPLDSKKSFNFYKRASELGLAVAQANLSFMYLNGEGTRKNPKLAWKWAIESKDQGYPRGMEFTGYMLGTGMGVKKNEKEAAFCYLLAARRGSVPAQDTLARLYERGTGVPVDMSESLLWRSRAREARRTKQPWTDATPLAEFPGEWTPPYRFVEELPAEAQVRTPNYSFQVSAPRVFASQKWSRHSGMIEKRNTALLIGLQGYDTLGVYVEARGKLAEGENVIEAAARLRPLLTFIALPGKENCAGMDVAAPYEMEDILLLVAVCLRPEDGEIYEIGVSRKSLALSTRMKSDAGFGGELTSAMRRVMETFRFE